MRLSSLRFAFVPSFMLGVVIIPPPHPDARLHAQAAHGANGALSAQPAQSRRVKSGYVLVANQQSASATIVDLARGTSVHIAVGDGPHEAIISPDGRTGVVTVYGARTPGNRLAIIDLAKATVARHIDLGRFTRPHGARFIAGSNTMLAVTSESTGRVVLVDLEKDSIVADIPTESALSHMVAIPSAGARAYTANIGSGSVAEVNLATRAFARTLPIAPKTEGIAVRPDGREVWIGSNETGEVSVVDTDRWAVVATVKGFVMPYRLDISPDNRLAVVVDPERDNVGIVDVATRTLLGTIGGLGSPRGVHIGDDNRTAFITSAGRSSVIEVDLVDRVIRGEYPVQGSPDGVAYSPWTISSVK